MKLSCACVSLLFTSIIYFPRKPILHSLCSSISELELDCSYCSASIFNVIFPLTCQVSIRLDGENKAVEYNAVGLTKDAVRAVFKNPEVDNLFDRNWHKIALSVEAKSVSLYLDCKHIQTLPIEDREDIDIQGKTVIGKRLYDSVPIDVSFHLHVFNI